MAAKDDGTAKGKGGDKDDGKKEEEKKGGKEKEGSAGDHGKGGPDKKATDLIVCRSCGQQRPVSMAKCPVCGAGAVPECHIEATLHEGKDGFQILVETTRNAKDQSMKFWYLLDGQNIGDEPKETDKYGSLVIPVTPSRKARYASFTVVGTRTKVKKPLYIPAAKHAVPRIKVGESVVEFRDRLAKWKKAFQD